MKQSSHYEVPQRPIQGLTHEAKLFLIHEAFIEPHCVPGPVLSADDTVMKKSFPPPWDIRSLVQQVQPCGNRGSKDL